jgi:hypothetical protein
MNPGDVSKSPHCQTAAGGDERDTGINRRTITNGILGARREPTAKGESKKQIQKPT